MSARGQVQGYQEQWWMQKPGHALVRQRICGRLQVLARGAWRDSPLDAHRISQNAGRAQQPTGGRSRSVSFGAWLVLLGPLLGICEA